MSEDSQADLRGASGTDRSTESKYEVLVFEDAGRCPLREFLDELSAAGRAAETRAVSHRVRLLELNGPLLKRPHTRLIDKKERIYELRTKYSRVAYIEVSDRRYVLLNGWLKKGQKLDPSEARRARRLAQAAREQLG